VEKIELKDRIGQIILVFTFSSIAVAFGFTSGTDSAIKNAVGISFQLIGFIAIMGGFSKGKHQRTLETGILLVVVGLLLQLLTLICTEFGYGELCEPN